ncbi:MAG: hypothetical protein IBX57_00455 [Gammaproteobacteria bacterium]|nr:hypothetical protein [Gammaproteobacteria bacterium]
MNKVSSYNNELAKINIELLERYGELIAHSENLNVSKEVLENVLAICSNSKSVTNGDKLSRWVGYIQAFLVFNDIQTVDDLRYSTRELYSSLYKEYNLPVESITV